MADGTSVSGKITSDTERGVSKIGREMRDTGCGRMIRESGGRKIPRLREERRGERGNRRLEMLGYLLSSDSIH